MTTPADRHKDGATPQDPESPEDTSLPWDERPITGPWRGVPWWAAVLIGFALAGLGALIDIQTQGAPGLLFKATYFLGSVGAVCLVRRRSLFAPMVQPPLILAIIIPGVVLLSSGIPDGGAIMVVLTVGGPLIKGFPTMAVTTVVTLAVGLVRLYRERDPNRPVKPTKSKTAGQQSRGTAASGKSTGGKQGGKPASGRATSGKSAENSSRTRDAGGGSGARSTRNASGSGRADTGRQRGSQPQRRPEREHSGREDRERPARGSQQQRKPAQSREAAQSPKSSQKQQASAGRKPPEGRGSGQQQSGGQQAREQRPGSGQRTRKPSESRDSERPSGRQREQKPNQPRSSGSSQRTRRDQEQRPQRQQPKRPWDE